MADKSLGYDLYPPALKYAATCSTPIGVRGKQSSLRCDPITLRANSWKCLQVFISESRPPLLEAASRSFRRDLSAESCVSRFVPAASASPLTPRLQALIVTMSPRSGADPDPALALPSAEVVSDVDAEDEPVSEEATK